MFFNSFIEHLLTLTWSQGFSFLFSAQVFGSSKPMNKKSALLLHPCESLQGIRHYPSAHAFRVELESVHVGSVNPIRMDPSKAPCYGFILLLAMTSLHTQASTGQSGFLPELHPNPASTYQLSPRSTLPNWQFLICSGH